MDKIQRYHELMEVFRTNLDFLKGLYADPEFNAEMEQLEQTDEQFGTVWGDLRAMLEAEAERC